MDAKKGYVESSDGGGAAESVPWQVTTSDADPASDGSDALKKHMEENEGLKEQVVNLKAAGNDLGTAEDKDVTM